MSPHKPAVMKVISDSQICSYLHANVTRETLLNEYIPLLVAGLKNYEGNPDGLPERIVRASATENSDTTHLFMPCILANNIGVKVISGGPSNLQKGLGFQGSISVLDDYTGELRAVLNAKSITAFRTALASCVGLVKAFPDSEGEMALLVFGAGPQSFWHVILAVKLYKILKISVISRNVSSAEALVQDLQNHVDVPVLSLALDDPRVLECVQSSSIVFGCTPSTEGIIQKEFINGDSSRRKYISLIGSYKPHMIELSLAYIQEQYADGTKIIVDSKSHCLAEAGELIQAGIGADQLVALSEVDTLDIATATSKSGAVLLKIVGLLVMDIIIAKNLSRAIAGTETEF